MSTRTKTSADLLAAMTALGWRSAAYMARLVGVTGANMSAFIGWRQPKSVNENAVADALWLCGFVCSDGVVDFVNEGVCPVISSHQLTKGDEGAVRHMFSLLREQGMHISVNEFVYTAMSETGRQGLTQPRGYLLTLHKRDPLAGIWAAVGIEPAGTESSTLSLLKELAGDGGFGSGRIRVSQRLYECWRSSGPRLAEVQDVIEMSDMWPQIIEFSRTLTASSVIEREALGAATNDATSLQQSPRKSPLAL